MKNAKHLLIHSACGAFVGLGIAASISGTSIPNFTTPIPLGAVPEYERLGRFAEFCVHWMSWGLLPLFLAIASSWLIIVRGLNPALASPNALKSWKTWAVAAASGVAVAAVAWAGLEGGKIFGALSINSEGIDFQLGMVLALVGGAVAWLIASPGGWGLPDEPGARRASRFETAALGAAFGAVVFAGGAPLDRLFDFLFVVNVEVWYPSTEVRLDALIGIAVILALLGAASFATAAGAAAMLASDGAGWPARLRRGAPGLAAAVLVAVGVLLLRQHARDAYDWNTGLVAAAALPDAAGTPHTLITLEFDKKPTVSSEPWNTDAWYGSWTLSGKVPATLANAEALRRFARAGKTSRYAQAAFSAIPPIYAQQWTLDRAFESANGDAKSTPMLTSLMERSWLAFSAPITPANRARLETLTDEKSFRIVGRHAFTAAKAWRRFGDLAKARHWAEKARATGASEVDLKELDLSSRPPLADGSVRGRIRLDGATPGDMTVGLFSLRDNAKSTNRITRSEALLIRLAAARRPGPDGSFTFDHLGEGLYSMAVLAPAGVPSGTKGATASPHPGIISLNRLHPRAELGTITIRAR